MLCDFIPTLFYPIIFASLLRFFQALSVLKKKNFLNIPFILVTATVSEQISSADKEKRRRWLYT